MNDKKQSYPVVRVVGLLTFSVLTLVGIIVGLPPDVVLIRIAVGTTLTMLIATALTRLPGLSSQ